MIGLEKEKPMQRLFDSKTLPALAGLSTFAAGFAYAAVHPCVECGIERDRCRACGSDTTLCNAVYQTCWQEHGCNPAPPGRPNAP